MHRLPVPIAEVVGENCKALRGRIGITQDDLARFARVAGLRWRATSVADFEAGRSAPTLATVLAVSAALQAAAVDAGGAVSVTFAELVACDDFVMVTESLVIDGAKLPAWAAGNASLHPPQAHDKLGQAISVATEFSDYGRSARTRELLEGVAGVLMRGGTPEYRVAKRLNIKPEVLAAASFRLWQRTFSEERDRLAGPQANRQKRGRVTRELQDELAAAIAEGGNEMAKILAGQDDNGNS